MRVSKERFQNWRPDPTWVLCEILDRSHPLWLVRAGAKRAPFVASMLRCFFERSKEEVASHFQTWAVWKHERFRAHLQRYPLIAVSFSGITAVEEGEETVRQALRRHAHIRKSLSPSDADSFDRILAGSFSPGWDWMAKYLFRGYGVKPVIIVESYDALVPARRARHVRTDELIVGLERAVPDLSYAVLIGRTSAAFGTLNCAQVESSARLWWTRREAS